MVRTIRQRVCHDDDVQSDRLDRQGHSPCLAVCVEGRRFQFIGRVLLLAGLRVLSEDSSDNTDGGGRACCGATGCLLMGPGFVMESNTEPLVNNA